MSIDFHPTVGVQKKKAIMLEVWSEAIGRVNEVDEKESLIIFEDFVVHLPALDHPFTEYVRGFRGKNVAVVRTDIPTAPYCVREIRDIECLIKPSQTQSTWGKSH